MTIEVIYVDHGSPGWYPVFYMASLAAELFEAELIVLRPRPLSTADKVFGLLPRRRHGGTGILICPTPADLASVLWIEKWRNRYGRLVAWVFDSFWPEWVHMFVRLGHIFDHVFVTEQEDLDTWRRMLHLPVDWLPWGSDTLRIGSPNPVRPIDLLRFGRQPTDWDDDESSAHICAANQLRFEGRPPMFGDAIQGQLALMRILNQTKFTLSFSNLVSPSAQTHPQREYITGRWTDALSAGATVAGVPPRSKTVQDLLWEDALLDVRTVDRNEGLAIVARAVREWTPHRAARNYLRSLEVLDWRWRFERLACVLNVRSQTLNRELTFLQQTIKDCRCGT
jgi:hypothetical protein